jgi:hypothetical protein
MTAPKGPTGHTYDLVQRAQIVCLKQYTNKTNDEISQITGADPSQIKRFNKQAIVRGFDKDGPLLSEHLENEKRPEVYSKAKDPGVIKDIIDHGRNCRATRTRSLIQMPLKVTVD